MSSCHYFLCPTDHHVMTAALLHILVFLNVFGEALALTRVTTYHPPLLPQTLVLANREFSYKECFSRTQS